MDASSILTPVVDNANMFQGKIMTCILNHFFLHFTTSTKYNIYTHIYVRISDDFLLYEDINDGSIEQAQQQAPESNKSSGSECTSLDGGSNRDDRYH